MSYGSNITLPCTIDFANPAPSYYWESVSEEDPLLEMYKILGDGLLQLKYVKESGVYQCTAWNACGSSVQIIELSKLNSYSFIHQHLLTKWTPCLNYYNYNYNN